MPCPPSGVTSCLVDGYNGDYAVWSDGTVVSYKRKKPKIMTGTPNPNGYICVSLSQNGAQKTSKIHKLVTNHFVPNPEQKRDVDHRDQDKTNNDVHNLRWTTHAENCQNKGKYSNNTTGITGVRVTNGGFAGQITTNGIYYSKSYKTLPEAAKWYAMMKAAFHITA